MDRLIKATFLLAFILLAAMAGAMAERVLKAGMRYKSDDKWKRVF